MTLNLRCYSANAVLRRRNMRWWEGGRLVRLEGEGECDPMQIKQRSVLTYLAQFRVLGTSDIRLRIHYLSTTELCLVDVSIGVFGYSLCKEVILFLFCSSQPLTQ